jgi:mannose-6-phosphate isomerase-like protein (cupin superfamily)
VRLRACLVREVKVLMLAYEADRSGLVVCMRGLADHFEKEDPAMHKTNTVDYAVVYEGEIWLELDDGEILHLKRGDLVVQNGTRHPWRNNGSKPVTMLFFLNGAMQTEQIREL